jgi:folate-binding protein YgfZ
MTSLAHHLDLLEHGVGAYRTSDRLLRVTGDDRLTWLQGQLTQDVLTLRPGGSAYALLLHPTGKILADLDVLCRETDLVLVCPLDAVDEVSAQLERYVMMEDVELERLPGAVLALQGPRAVALRGAIRDARGTDAVFEVDRLGRGGLLVLESADGGEDAVGAGAALLPCVVEAGGGWVSAEATLLARLRAGRPAFGADFGPSVLPQVAGLTRRAVSFKKGCYRGQEPVVMLEHRGSPPKRLVRLEIEAADALPAGTSLSAADGAPLGAITSAARGPDGVVYALGTLKRGAALSDVTCAGDDGQRHPARALEFAE